MKTLGKAAEIAAAAIFIFFILWILTSWADVLAHQFQGDQHAWNLFRIVVEFYYGR